MEIIGGKYKGRKLIAPSQETRPTLARVKSSIFSMIDEYIRGYRVLDLFAGSGAMGLECVSRGAYQTVLVDNSLSSEQVVKSNSKNMKENIEFIKGDYLETLKMLKDRNECFDLIFLDPPYKSDYAQKAFDYIYENDLICQGGVVVHERLTELNSLKLPDTFQLLKSKKYADKTVDISIFKE